MKAEYNIARMVVLSLETVTRQGSVALLIEKHARVGEKDARGGDEVCHARLGDASRTHGERLPAELLALLEEHGLALHDVDLLAVVAGPGSFTGLRVGMATVQGLALAAARRVVAIPTLEGMVEGWRIQQASGLGPHASEDREPRSDASISVIACLDGQRGDLFFAGWTLRVDEPVERGVPVIEPSVGSIDDLVRLVAARGILTPVVLVELGVSRYAASLTALGRVDEISSPLAGTAARMAARRADRATAPHALRPVYIRRPDAELARERAGLPRP
jgi:tRNA threonylcarbamoyl adenosine modification protein YeaZ